MKILDATCGNRGIWFDKHQKDTIFIDMNPDCRPDRIRDCRKTGFENQYFDLIIFDPPHDSRTKNNKGVFRKYGCLRAKEIKELISESFKEFHRILKENGFVLFKWNTRQFKLKMILNLINNFEALIGQKTATRKKHFSETYWICFKKS